MAFKIRTRFRYEPGGTSIQSISWSVKNSDVIESYHNASSPSFSLFFSLSPSENIQMTAHGEEFFGFDVRIGSVLKTIISPWVWCTTKNSCYGKQIDYVQKSQLQSSESLLVLFSMQHLQSRQGITDEKSLGVSFGKERNVLTVC